MAEKTKQSITLEHDGDNISMSFDPPIIGENSDEYSQMNVDQKLLQIMAVAMAKHVAQGLSDD